MKLRHEARQISVFWPYLNSSASSLIIDTVYCMQIQYEKLHPTFLPYLLTTFLTNWVIHICMNLLLRDHVAWVSILSILAKARVQSKLSLTLCHNWMQLMGAGLQLKSSWEQDDTQTVQIAAKSTSKHCRNALDECFLPSTEQRRRGSHHL